MGANSLVGVRAIKSNSFYGTSVVYTCFIVYTRVKDFFRKKSEKVGVK